MIEGLYDELNNLSIEDIEKNIGLFTKNVIKNLKTEKFSLTTNNHFNISIKQNREKINEYQRGRKEQTNQYRKQKRKDDIEIKDDT